MAKEFTLVATISRLERLRSSVNGNPRFRIHWENGGHNDLQSDASLGYGIENPEYQGVPLKVTTTKSGKVTYARPLTDTWFDKGWTDGFTEGSPRVLEGQPNHNPAYVQGYDAGVRDREAAHERL